MQISVSGLIARWLKVLPTIYFDDGKFLSAHEVADVVADWFLTDEFVPVDLPISNSIPQLSFRIGLIDAQLARSVNLLVWATHYPAPHPEAALRAVFDLSPQAGRG